MSSGDRQSAQGQGSSSGKPPFGSKSLSFRGRPKTASKKNFVLADGHLLGPALPETAAAVRIVRVGGGSTVRRLFTFGSAQVREDGTVPAPVLAESSSSAARVIWEGPVLYIAKTVHDDGKTPAIVNFQLHYCTASQSATSGGASSPVEASPGRHGAWQPIPGIMEDATLDLAQFLNSRETRPEVTHLKWPLKGAHDGDKDSSYILEVTVIHMPAGSTAGTMRRIQGRSAGALNASGSTELGTPPTLANLTTTGSVSAIPSRTGSARSDVTAASLPPLETEYSAEGEASPSYMSPQPSLPPTSSAASSPVSITTAQQTGRRGSGAEVGGTTNIPQMRVADVEASNVPSLEVQGQGPSLDTGRRQSSAMYSDSAGGGGGIPSGGGGGVSATGPPPPIEVAAASARDDDGSNVIPPRHLVSTPVAMLRGLQQASMPALLPTGKAAAPNPATAVAAEAAAAMTAAAAVAARRIQASRARGAGAILSGPIGAAPGGCLPASFSDIIEQRPASSPILYKETQLSVEPLPLLQKQAAPVLAVSLQSEQPTATATPGTGLPFTPASAINLATETKPTLSKPAGDDSGDDKARGLRGPLPVCIIPNPPSAASFSVPAADIRPLSPDTAPRSESTEPPSRPGSQPFAAFKPSEEEDSAEEVELEVERDEPIVGSLELRPGTWLRSGEEHAGSATAALQAARLAAAAPAISLTHSASGGVAPWLNAARGAAAAGFLSSRPEVAAGGGGGGDGDGSPVTSSSSVGPHGSCSAPSNVLFPPQVLGASGDSAFAGDLDSSGKDVGRGSRAGAEGLAGRYLGSGREQSGARSLTPASPGRGGAEGLGQAAAYGEGAGMDKAGEAGGRPAGSAATILSSETLAARAMQQKEGESAIARGLDITPSSSTAAAQGRSPALWVMHGAPPAPAPVAASASQTSGSVVGGREMSAGEGGRGHDEAQGGADTSESAGGGAGANAAEIPGDRRGSGGGGGSCGSAGGLRAGTESEERSCWVVRGVGGSGGGVDSGTAHSRTSRTDLTGTLESRSGPSLADVKPSAEITGVLDMHPPPATQLDPNPQPPVALLTNEEDLVGIEDLERGHTRNAAGRRVADIEPPAAGPSYLANNTGVRGGDGTAATMASAEGSLPMGFEVMHAVLSGRPEAMARAAASKLEQTTDGGGDGRAAVGLDDSASTEGEGEEGATLQVVVPAGNLTALVLGHGAGESVLSDPQVASGCGEEARISAGDGSINVDREASPPAEAGGGDGASFGADAEEAQAPVGVVGPSEDGDGDSAASQVDAFATTTTSDSSPEITQHTAGESTAGAPVARDHYAAGRRRSIHLLHRPLGLLAPVPEDTETREEVIPMPPHGFIALSSSSSNQHPDGGPYVSSDPRYAAAARAAVEAGWGFQTVAMNEWPLGEPVDAGTTAEKLVGERLMRWPLHSGVERHGKEWVRAGRGVPARDMAVLRRHYTEEAAAGEGSKVEDEASTSLPKSVCEGLVGSGGGDSGGVGGLADFGIVIGGGGGEGETHAVGVAETEDAEETAAQAGSSRESEEAAEAELDELLQAVSGGEGGGGGGGEEEVLGEDAESLDIVGEEGVPLGGGAERQLPRTMGEEAKDEISVRPVETVAVQSVVEVPLLLLSGSSATAPEADLDALQRTGHVRDEEMASGTPTTRGEEVKGLSARAREEGLVDTFAAPNEVLGRAVHGSSNSDRGRGGGSSLQPLPLLQDSPTTQLSQPPDRDGSSLDNTDTHAIGTLTQLPALPSASTPTPAISPPSQASPTTTMGPISHMPAPTAAAELDPLPHLEALPEPGTPDLASQAPPSYPSQQQSESSVEDGRQDAPEPSWEALILRPASSLELLPGRVVSTDVPLAAAAVAAPAAAVAAEWRLPDRDGTGSVGGGGEVVDTEVGDLRLRRSNAMSREGASAVAAQVLRAGECGDGADTLPGRRRGRKELHVDRHGHQRGGGGLGGWLAARGEMALRVMAASAVCTATELLEGLRQDQPAEPYGPDTGLGTLSLLRPRATLWAHLPWPLAALARTGFRAGVAVACGGLAAVDVVREAFGWGSMGPQE